MEILKKVCLGLTIIIALVVMFVGGSPADMIGYCAALLACNTIINYANGASKKD